MVFKKSNDPYDLDYKMTRNTLDAVGIITHAVAKSLSDGSKIYTADYIDLIVR